MTVPCKPRVQYTILVLVVVGVIGLIAMTVVLGGVLTGTTDDNEETRPFNHTLVITVENIQLVAQTPNGIATREGQDPPIVPFPTTHELQYLFYCTLEYWDKYMTTTMLAQNLSSSMNADYQTLTLQPWIGIPPPNNNATNNGSLLRLANLEAVYHTAADPMTTLSWSNSVLNLLNQSLVGLEAFVQERTTVEQPNDNRWCARWWSVQNQYQYHHYQLHHLTSPWQEPASNTPWLEQRIQYSISIAVPPDTTSTDATAISDWVWVERTNDFIQTILVAQMDTIVGVQTTLHYTTFPHSCLSSNETTSTSSIYLALESHVWRTDTTGIHGSAQEPAGNLQDWWFQQWQDFGNVYLEEFVRTTVQEEGPYSKASDVLVRPASFEYSAADGSEPTSRDVICQR